jgi:predicted aspartyl protease
MSILLTVVIFGILIFRWCINSTKISYTVLHFDKNEKRLFLNGNLLWDTGSNGSVIYEEYKSTIPHRIQIGYSFVFDTFHKMRFVPFFYSHQFGLSDSVNIRNFFFALISTKIQDNVIGLIGMDVISKTNWIIDFTSEKVKILPQDKIYETKELSKLNLKYKRNRVPKTQLDFSVCQLKNVLIDAGFDAEIALLKSDIEGINEKYKPVDTLKTFRYGIYSTAPTIQNIYVYDSIMINHICFQNVQIMENSKRLIGFAFFKRFNKVFLNTKEREFYFYE